MVDYRQPSRQDLERNLSAALHSAHQRASDERTKLVFSYNSKGTLDSTMFVSAVEHCIDGIHVEAVTEAMNVLNEFSSRLDAPSSEIASWAEPHLGSVTDALVGLMMPQGQQSVARYFSAAREHYRPLFNQRVDKALRDFEVGFINGRSIRQGGVGDTRAPAQPSPVVNSTPYVSQERHKQLKLIAHPDFDLKRLIRLCEELDVNWTVGNYFSVPALVRAIMDHIPPVFACRAFDQVRGSHGDRTFKAHMSRLDDSLRHVADASLHRHIRRSDTLPTDSQVNFSAELDVLLGEVIAKLARP